MPATDSDSCPFGGVGVWRDGWPGSGGAARRGEGDSGDSDGGVEDLVPAEVLDVGFSRGGKWSGANPRRRGSEVQGQGGPDGLAERGRKR